MTIKSYEVQLVIPPAVLAAQNERLLSLVAELIRKNEELRQRLATAIAEEYAGRYGDGQGWA